MMLRCWASTSSVDLITIHIPCCCLMLPHVVFFPCISSIFLSVLYRVPFFGRCVLCHLILPLHLTIC